MLVVCDEESGNYLSTRSFWSEDGERWGLYVYDGKLGVNFYGNQQTANAALEQLQVYNKREV